MPLPPSLTTVVCVESSQMRQNDSGHDNRVIRSTPPTNTTETAKQETREPRKLGERSFNDQEDNIMNCRTKIDKEAKKGVQACLLGEEKEKISSQNVKENPSEDDETMPQTRSLTYAEVVKINKRSSEHSMPSQLSNSIREKPQVEENMKCSHRSLETRLPISENVITDGKSKTEHTGMTFVVNSQSNEASGQPVEQDRPIIPLNNINPAEKTEEPLDESVTSNQGATKLSYADIVRRPVEKTKTRAVNLRVGPYKEKTPTDGQSHLISRRRTGENHAIQYSSHCTPQIDVPKSEAKDERQAGIKCKKDENEDDTHSFVQFGESHSRAIGTDEVENDGEAKNRSLLNSKTQRYEVLFQITVVRNFPYQEENFIGWTVSLSETNEDSKINVCCTVERGLRNSSNDGPFIITVACSLLEIRAVVIPCTVAFVQKVWTSKMFIYGEVSVIFTAQNFIFSFEEIVEQDHIDTSSMNYHMQLETLTAKPPEGEVRRVILVDVFDQKEHSLAHLKDCQLIVSWRMNTLSLLLAKPTTSNYLKLMFFVISGPSVVSHLSSPGKSCLSEIRKLDELSECNKDLKLKPYSAVKVARNWELLRPFIDETMNCSVSTAAMVLNLLYHGKSSLLSVVKHLAANEDNKDSEKNLIYIIARGNKTKLVEYALTTKGTKTHVLSAMLQALMKSRRCDVECHECSVMRWEDIHSRAVHLIRPQVAENSNVWTLWSSTIEKSMIDKESRLLLNYHGNILLMSILKLTTTEDNDSNLQKKYKGKTLILNIFHHALQFSQGAYGSADAIATNPTSIVPIHNLVFQASGRFERHSDQKKAHFLFSTSKLQSKINDFNTLKRIPLSDELNHGTSHSTYFTQKQITLAIVTKSAGVYHSEDPAPQKVNELTKLWQSRKSFHSIPSPDDYKVERQKCCIQKRFVSHGIVRGYPVNVRSHDHHSHTECDVGHLERAIGKSVIIEPFGKSVTSETSSSQPKNCNPAVDDWDSFASKNFVKICTTRNPAFIPHAKKKSHISLCAGSCSLQYKAVHEPVVQLLEGPAIVGLCQPPPKRSLQGVEPDGKVSDVANDPPGQQSTYIPPGDSRKEAYRLSTYDSFPRTVPVNIVDLAKQGFSYTGFGDRVKCYSCGRTVEKWESTDNPKEKRWHKPDCQLAQGRATDNVPIGGLFNQAFAVTRRNDNTPHSAGTSQNFNGPIVNFGNDLGDRLSRGGTYQIQPGNGLFISPTAPPIPTGPASAPGPNHAPVRQWRMANVISADHRRYLTNLYLTRELDRLASFCRWPTGRPNVAPVALARAGFFYLGDMDRTQCFSCGGVLRNWTAEDDAVDEHRTHFPTCPFILGNDHRNVPIPQLQETQQQLSDAYPCRYPANPHMRSEAARAETFDRRWPMNRTRAPPSEIAEAGFFFLGERDRVKCFYCNGGLQNWEFDDKPWIEHAKWFPNCQFLLKRQGQFFVYRHLSLSPHLPRPIIGRQEGATIDPAPPGELRRGQDVPPITAGTRARGPTPPPTIIDPQEEMRKRKERVDKEMRENNNVKMVIAFGYEERVVRKVLEEQLEAEHAADSENIFNGMEPLLDAVQAREADIKRELEEEEHATRVKEVEQPMSVTFPSISSNYSEMSMSTMETLPSVASHASGAVNVSGFDHDSDDEDMTDLYGSVVEGPSIGAAAAGPSMVSTANMPYQAIDIPDDPESIKEMIEQKKEERLCKICFTEQADMVFIPCSHMCCCKECTQAIRQCPVCRKKIEKAIRTYLK